MESHYEIRDGVLQVKGFVELFESRESASAVSETREGLEPEPEETETP